MAATSKLIFVLVAGLTLVSLRLSHRVDLKLPPWLAPLVLAISVVVVLGSLAGLVYLQYQAFAAPLWLYSNPIWHAAAGIGLHLTLAVLFGYLVHLTINYLYGSNAVTTVQALALLAPTTFILLFALFATEVRDFYERMSHVGVAGVVIDIADDRDDSGKIRVDREPEEFQSDFKRGIYLYELAASRLRSDLENILRLCRTYLPDADAAVTCSFGRPAPARHERMHFGPYSSPSDPNLPLAREMLEHQLVFMQCVMPYAAALSQFQRHFPNGVPIQDDLSEVASGYAKLIAAAPAVGAAARGDPVADPMFVDLRPSTRVGPLATIAPAGGDGYVDISGSFEFNLDRIRTILLNFERRYLPDAWHPTERPEVCADGALPHAHDLLAASRLAAAHEAAFFVTAFGSARCDPDEVEGLQTRTRLELPYRPMLRAGLLAAAGYPLEAASHLENALMCFTAKAAVVDTHAAAIHLPSTVMRIRVLAQLETLYQQAREQDRQLATLRRRLDVTKRWMDWQLGADTLDLASLLEACAGGDWTEPTVLGAGDRPEAAFVSAITASLGHDAAIAETKAALSEYIRHHVFAYTSDLNRYHYFRSGSEAQVGMKDLEVAESFVDVAIREPAVLDGCFGTISFWNAGWADLTRVELVETSALVHAHRAMELSQGRDTIDAADRINADIRYHACRARDLFDWAHGLAGDMIAMGASAGHADVYGAFTTSAGDMQRRMRRLRVGIRPAAENCGGAAAPTAL